VKVYQENINKHDAQIIKLTKALNRISVFRLLVFIISSIVLVSLLSFNLLTPVFIVLPFSILSFAFLIKRYNKIAFTKKQAAFLKGINESEILRGKWKSKNQKYLRLWSEAVSEFEVLNSFAGFYYSNPSFSFPEIIENKHFIHFES
jgi:ABC-type protease/lipase transport system fused ATPase/permease subunit